MAPLPGIRPRIGGDGRDVALLEFGTEGQRRACRTGPIRARHGNLGLTVAPSRPHAGQWIERSSDEILGTEPVGQYSWIAGLV